MQQLVKQKIDGHPNQVDALIQEELLELRVTRDVVDSCGFEIQSICARIDR
jgi:hypothetical protein